MSEENLWGDLSLNVRLKTPLAILKIQAVALSKATRGLLDGTVLAFNAGRNRFGYEFRVMAPALGNYTTVLLRITHDVTLYPVTINNEVNGSFFEAEDEENLKERLREVFHSEPVRRVVNALIAQSTEAADHPAPA